MGNQTQFGIVTVGALALLATGLMQRSPGEAPVSKSTDGVPNILKVGDVHQAIRQCEELVEALNRVHGDRTLIPFRLKRFKDQKYAENPSIRDPRVAYISIPQPQSEVYKEIACFTDLYVRRNIARFANEITESDPEGFYLVGYKNGEVKQIPVTEVRLLPKELQTQYQECFPGQAIYKKSLPQLDYVANAHKRR